MRGRLQESPRRGFSLIEIIVVLVILGVVAGLAVPRLSLSGYRVDAIAQQVQGILRTSQRTSLTRQYDVMVSIDTLNRLLRIAEDSNNSGTIEVTEVKVWRPTGRAEGNVFAVPPRGVNTVAVNSSVTGSALLKVNGLPTIVFHRDGSASSDAEIYVANSSRGQPQFRAITLTRSTGRTEMYRLAGSGSAATWRVAR